MPSKKTPRGKDEVTSKHPTPKLAARYSEPAARRQPHTLTVIQRAGLNPAALSAVDVLLLQRTFGNRGTGRLLAGATQRQTVQPKLVVGPARNKFEREADQVAAQVMSRVSTPQIHAEFPRASARRDTSRGGAGISDGESLLKWHAQPQPAEDGLGVSDEIDSSIRSARGGGRPMPEAVRASMEDAFGVDFDGVKVHTGSEADALTRSVQARAFTTGQDIFFRAGEYAPGSWQGQQLLAHELAHVVQQGGGETPRATEAPVLQRFFDINGDKYYAEKELPGNIKAQIQGLRKKEPQVHAKLTSWLTDNTRHEATTIVKLIADARVAVGSETQQQQETGGGTSRGKGTETRKGLPTESRRGKSTKVEKEEHPDESALNEVVVQYQAEKGMKEFKKQETLPTLKGYYYELKEVLPFLSPKSYKEFILDAKVLKHGKGTKGTSTATAIKITELPEKVKFLKEQAGSIDAVAQAAQQLSALLEIQVSTLKERLVAKIVEGNIREFKPKTLADKIESLFTVMTHIMTFESQHRITPKAMKSIQRTICTHVEEVESKKLVQVNRELSTGLKILATQPTLILFNYDEVVYGPNKVKLTDLDLVFSSAEQPEEPALNVEVEGVPDTKWKEGLDAVAAYLKERWRVKAESRKKANQEKAPMMLAVPRQIGKEDYLKLSEKLSAEGVALIPFEWTQEPAPVKTEVATESEQNTPVQINALQPEGLEKIDPLAVQKEYVLNDLLKDKDELKMALGGHDAILREIEEGNGPLLIELLDAFQKNLEALIKVIRSNVYGSLKELHQGYKKNEFGNK